MNDGKIVNSLEGYDIEVCRRSNHDGCKVWIKEGEEYICSLDERGFRLRGSRVKYATEKYAPEVPSIPENVQKAANMAWEEYC